MNVLYIQTTEKHPYMVDISFMNIPHLNNFLKSNSQKAVPKWSHKPIKKLAPYDKKVLCYTSYIVVHFIALFVIPLYHMCTYLSGISVWAPRRLNDDLIACTLTCGCDHWVWTHTRPIYKIGLSGRVFTLRNSIKIVTSNNIANKCWWIRKKAQAISESWTLMNKL